MDIVSIKLRQGLGIVMHMEGNGMLSKNVWFYYQFCDTFDVTESNLIIYKILICRF